MFDMPEPKKIIVIGEHNAELLAKALAKQNLEQMADRIEVCDDPDEIRVAPDLTVLLAREIEEYVDTKAEPNRGPRDRWNRLRR